MRIVTQTLPTGKVVAKGGNRQRTVEPTGHPSRDHAQAVVVLLGAHGRTGFDPDTLPQCQKVNDTRLVWEV